jgi:hypothetical protein
MTIASMGQGGSSLPETVSRELARNACGHGGSASVPAQSISQARRGQAHPAAKLRSAARSVEHGAELAGREVVALTCPTVPTCQSTLNTIAHSLNNRRRITHAFHSPWRRSHERSKGLSNSNFSSLRWVAHVELETAETKELQL